MSHAQAPSRSAYRRLRNRQETVGGSTGARVRMRHDLSSPIRRGPRRSWLRTGLLLTCLAVPPGGSEPSTASVSGPISRSLDLLFRRSRLLSWENGWPLLAGGGRGRLPDGVPDVAQPAVGRGRTMDS